MKFDCRRLGQFVKLGTLILAGIGAARADSFYISYLAPGVQTPAGITNNYETFDSLAPYSSFAKPYVTNFNGNSYSGTYSGTGRLLAADEYGGAGGTGTYLATSGSYILAINKPVNYFGLWFSALDGENQLNFYNTGALVYSFSANDYGNTVGACPGNPHCGNPNQQFAGENGYQQYAYLNFYDPSGSFNEVQVTENDPFSGLESDNHAVDILTSVPAGTEIAPEPKSLGLTVVSGLLFLAGSWFLSDSKKRLEL